MTTAGDMYDADYRRRLGLDPRCRCAERELNEDCPIHGKGDEGLAEYRAWLAEERVERLRVADSRAESPLKKFQRVWA